MKHTNSLIHESSPYLLQHAHNPVNWRAWNEETFRMAEEEDKPIFLSIGYATCHWCHVMEHESFEDEEVAALLNEHCICVKVDREERPDVDAVYMAVCQAMTGHGGWPLSVFMTPEKKPFFVGTYFPKENGYGRPGFVSILEQLSLAWVKDRAKVIEAGEGIIRSIQERSSADYHSVVNESIFDESFSRYHQSFDKEYGGFHTQPKFPSPQNFLFLLRYYKRTGNAHALIMVEKTLQQMRMGGLFDHVGFGFHRYSTDKQWLLPHFEKMLYDQAMLTMAYTEAWQVTENLLFRRTVEEVCAYVLRDMTSPYGGFYSAEDADSEGVEGKFYVWSKKEIDSHLTAEEAMIFAGLFNIEEMGNFAEEATGHMSSDNIPHLRMMPADYAREHGLDEQQLNTLVAAIRAKLFLIREERVHPLKDDKILTDWNGLMIVALAKAGKAFGREEYILAAERAFGFVVTTLRREDGRLLHRYRQGQAGIEAFLDDYAFMAWAAFELYQTTFSIHYLRQTQWLCDEMLRLFSDSHGGFQSSASDNEQLLVRSKEGYDGAIPSGNSVAAFVLARLGKLMDTPVYLDKALQTVESFGRQIVSYPIGFAQMLCAFDLLVHPTREIVLAGQQEEVQPMMETLAAYYLPFAVMAYNDESEELAQLVEYATRQKARDNKPTVYICEQYACQEPITERAVLQKVLSE